MLFILHKQIIPVLKVRYNIITDKFNMENLFIKVFLFKFFITKILSVIELQMTA